MVEEEDDVLKKELMFSKRESDVRSV